MSIDMTLPNYSITVLPEIVKGNSDWREYHAIELPNGVKCVFVNDKESKTTACSVCIGTGASGDPRELSGLAHFTEHMCFLGSEAYPIENEFKKYLSSHGGRSNASTSMSETVYKFDILADHAEKAIDIFSNFFISPLFTKSGTSREVNAVDSENSKNISNDSRRRLQVLKALANPNHHYSKFSTGNAKTLAMDEEVGIISNNPSGIDIGHAESRTAFIREALLAFHRRHYRPDNMVVVVVGPQSLETLQKWIVPQFAQISNRWEAKNEGEMSKAELIVEAAAKDSPNDAFESKPVPHNPPFDTKYQSNTWPIMLTTLPLKSLRKLYIYFPLPSVTRLNDRSPYHIICHLLGHEGPGSCFATLQDAELVDAISVGPRLSEIDHSLLQINISLSEKGEEHWEDVIAIIFDYCKLMYDTLEKASKHDRAKAGNTESGAALNEIIRIWGEIQHIKSLRFHQSSPGEALTLAPFLASSVRRNGTHRSMSVGSMIDENHDTIPIATVLEFLGKMIPQNCFIERCSQSAWQEQQEKHADKRLKEENNQYPFGLNTERWYGIDYYLTDICRKAVDRWDWKQKSTDNRNASLFLPVKNNYLPTDLSLCADLPDEATEKPRIEKEIDPPKLIVDDKCFGRLWHRLDDRYCLPKASLTILFRNPVVQHKWDEKKESWVFDPSAGVHSGILLNTFVDAFAQPTYDAELAGLHWSMDETVSGLVLKCDGYSQHLIRFALYILEHFFNEEATFISDRLVRTNKDRMMRHLSSYLTSKRADTYASYYTNLLMSFKGLGVKNKFELSKQVSTETVKAHHHNLISRGLNKAECLISGNIGQRDAETFFSRVCQIIGSIKSKFNSDIELSTHERHFQFIPGPSERSLNAGEDIFLHFQSENTEEQNGAVTMKFQSPIPAFKGIQLDSPVTKESLIHTAALRVLCHMLREPLFNQLRTKEQLGYVVNSYYDLDFASRWIKGDKYSFETIPINSIVVNVLSRKVPPHLLTKRIDEFLDSFRAKLLTTPEDEFNNHKYALNKKLLTPIKRLGVEVDAHFGKIKRFAPEVLNQNEYNKCDTELPWNTKFQLAAAIKDLHIDDLLKAWDTVVSGKYRSRVVSQTYGSSFRLDEDRKKYLSKLKKNVSGRKIVHIVSTTDIFEKRKLMKPFGCTTRKFHASPFKSITKQISHQKLAIGVAAGTSLLLYAFNMWSHKHESSKGTSQKK